MKPEKFAAVGLCLAAAASGCAPRTSVKRDHASTTIEETRHHRSEQKGPKRRIGIIDFENKSGYGQNRLGTAASDILITELVKSDRFIVVERSKMEKLMEEQKLGMTGAISPETAAKVGRILGLTAIVTGAISQAGVKTVGSDYLVTQSKKQIAEVTVDIRVVDVETGQILLADSGKGTAKSSKGSLLGLGTRGGYDETLEGEAMRAAVVQFVDNIVSQVSRKPWSAMVADASGAELYINAGQESGMELGMKLDCFRTGAPIKDPDSGLVIGYKETPLGAGKIVRWCGQTGDCAVVRLEESGSGGKTRDICRLPE